jgi:hypothetical protein
MTPAAEKDVWGRQNMRSILFYLIIFYVNNSVFLSAESTFGYKAILLFAFQFCFSYLRCGYFVTGMYMNISLLHYVTNSVVGHPESETPMMTNSTVPHE